MKEKLVIDLGYNPPNWNDYINAERSNKFKAAGIKKKELKIVERYVLGKKYSGTYPAKITFIKYFKNKRQDLDNTRVKGILDGLVKCGVIENDNLTKIVEIELIAKFDKEKEGIRVIIEPL